MSATAIITSRTMSDEEVRVRQENQRRQLTVPNKARIAKRGGGKGGRSGARRAACSGW